MGPVGPVAPNDTPIMEDAVNVETVTLVALTVEPVNVEKLILDVTMLEPNIEEKEIDDAEILDVVIVQPDNDEKVEKDRPGTKILEPIIVDATKFVTNIVEPINDEKLIEDAVILDVVIVQPVNEEKVEKDRPGTKILDAIRLDATILVPNTVDPNSVE